MPGSPRPPEGLSPGRVVAWVLIPLAALLLAALLLARAVELEFIDLTRDVFSTASIPVYTGLVSNVGAFLWVAGLTICLFARGIAPAGERGFLLASAGITAVMLVDDFYMVHEWIGPNFLGIPEEGFYLAYALMGGGYVVAYRDRILRGSGGTLLLATGLAFAVSLGIDLLERPPVAAWQTFAEEGTKLLGIGCWVSYLATMAAMSVRFADPLENAPAPRTGKR